MIMDNKLNYPAILGGEKVRKNPLPTYNMIGDEEKSAVMKVLDSGVLSGFAAQPNRDFFGGPIIEKLENDYCEKFNSTFATAINSATTGLHAALAATGVGPGDEVIVPPYTMSATATAVVYCGAVPVFADIEEDTYCLDPKSVETKISKNTKAIITVNLFGLPSSLLKLRKLADDNQIFLIEDNAQAPGAMIKEKFTGTIGDFGIFSLNRHKAMQCGEGGVVLSNDLELTQRLRLVRNHGEVLVEAMNVKNISNMIGLNYRMTNMEAAVAIEQLKKLEIINEPRIELANRLSENLKHIEGIDSPLVRDDCTHVYYFYAMRYDEDIVGMPRKIFCQSVEAEGFTLKSGYVRPIYLEPMYQQKIGFGNDGFPFSANDRINEINYSKNSCPNCENIQDHKLIWTNIIYPPLENSDMDQFCYAIEKVIKNKELIMSNQNVSVKNEGTLYD